MGSILVFLLSALTLLVLAAVAFGFARHAADLGRAGDDTRQVRHFGELFVLEGVRAAHGGGCALAKFVGWRLGGVACHGVTFGSRDPRGGLNQ